MTSKDCEIKDDYSPQIENNLVELIKERSGITFDSAKRRELKHDILVLMEDLKIYSYEKYYFYLTEGKNRESEIKKLINMSTINETFFFRVQDHFIILNDTLIPKIIKKNKNQPIRIWCAGCSSGEEVYSIAITMFELKSKHYGGLDFEVIGTDINDDMIASAKKGAYSGRTLNLVPEHYLGNYFDEKNNQYFVKDFVKEKTSFEYLNLTDDFTSKFEKKLDIVFFRNVFIYFNRETNIKIIESFYSILKKEGYLFLGPSETLWKLTDKFELWMFENSYIYQKPGNDSIEIKEIGPQKIKKQLEGDYFFENHEDSIANETEQSVSSQSDGIQSENKTNNADRLAKAADFINIADYKNAEKIIDDILKNEEANKDAVILKLLVFSNRSDKSGLLSFSKNISNTVPVFPELHYILGNYFESLGEIDQALNSFKKAIFIDRELIQPREKILNLKLASKNIPAAKLEAKNLIIQIKRENYKFFSSQFLPKVNIEKLKELCIKIQAYK